MTLTTNAVHTATLHRLAAFADVSGGGNPAGVWVGDDLPTPTEMLRIAADLGYSETAFVAPVNGRERTIRYFSPLAEVPFCGHATIATGVVLGSTDGAGSYRLATRVGDVVVDVRMQDDRWHARLQSVPPRQRPLPPQLRDDVLALLGWHLDELDPALPPVLAYAGAWHLVLASSTRARLDRLDYDFEAMKALMQQHELTTLQLVWRESAARFHARNPFPVGGVVEDPATGAAAAALGGWLRDAGLISAPARFEIIQGVVMGRPSRIDVEVPASGGIFVAGTALSIERE